PIRGSGRAGPRGVVAGRTQCGLRRDAAVEPARAEGEYRPASHAEADARVQAGCAAVRGCAWAGQLRYRVRRSALWFQDARSRDRLVARKEVLAHSCRGACEDTRAAEGEGQADVRRYVGHDLQSLKECIMNAALSSSRSRRRLGAVLFLLAAPSIALAQRGGPRTPRADSLREASRLDSEGSTPQARAILQRLIDGAPDPAAKAESQRALAMSYAFDGDCASAAKSEELVIAYWITREQAEPQNAFYQEGEMANEAARVCIDAGDFN